MNRTLYLSEDPRIICYKEKTDTGYSIYWCSHLNDIRGLMFDSIIIMETVNT